MPIDKKLIMTQFVKINALKMILELADRFENSKGIRKLCDDEGNIIVPTDRFGDFCHDIGIIVGKAIQHVAEPYE